MEKQLKDLCIKCEGKKLKEFLAKYTKPKLKSILDAYGEKLPSSAKKQEMVDCAAAAIEAEFAVIFSEQVYNEKADFLSKVAKNGLTLGDAAEFEKIRAFYEKGLLFLTESSAGAKVKLPAEAVELAGMEIEEDDKDEENYVQLQIPIDVYSDLNDETSEKADDAACDEPDSAACDESGNEPDSSACAESGDKPDSAACAESGDEVDSAACAESGDKPDSAACDESGDKPDGAACDESDDEADGAACAGFDNDASYIDSDEDDQTLDEKVFSSKYVKPENRSKQENEIIRYARALANMCGIVTISQLRDQWNMNHVHDSLSPSAIINAVKKSGKEDGFYLEEPVFIVTNLLESVEKGREITEKYIRGEAYKYASEEDIKAFEDSPQIDNSEEYIYLHTYLERSAGEDAAKKIIDELFLLAMHDPYDEEIMEFIENSSIAVPENEKEQLLLMIREWMYYLHIWACKGWMPSEINEEKLEGRNFKLEKGHHFKKIAKMGRNEPCPCLSGKKFKNCCMKRINN